MSADLLSVADVAAGYDRADVLHGVSLSVGPGEFVCVIGANTAGKSTLLRTISRLVPRSSGRIAFDGRDLTRLPAHEVPALGIAHVPEGRHVFFDMSVEDNLLTGAFSRRTDPGIPARMEEIFTLFPRLRERRAQRAGSMSGGEQQMVALGRAVMSAPKILIVDEPSVGLAPSLVIRTIDKIRELKDQYHLTVLMAEQNFTQAIRIADKGYVIVQGEIAFRGESPDEMRQSDLIRQYYLGL